MMSNWLTISQSAGTGNATITVTPQSNPGFERRTARIVVSNGTISKTVSVVQEAKTPSLSAITVTAVEYLYAPYSGGTVTSADSKNHLVVTAIYDNGDVVDVTSAATYASDSDEFTIPVSTSTAATFTQHWFYWRVEYQNKVGEYFDYLYQQGVPETNRFCYSGTTAMIPRSTSSNDWGASILTSAFTDGHGIIVFDGNVTRLGNGQGSTVFSNTSGLTAFDVPSTVENIGQYAFFNSTALTTVNGFENTDSPYIPPENSYSAAFKNCTSLTHIGLPNDFTRFSGYKIKGEFFANCTSLTTIQYNGTMDEFNAISKAPTWREGSALRYVECSDGTIDLDPSIDIVYYSPTQLPISASTFTPSADTHTFSNGVGHISSSQGDITKIGNEAFRRMPLTYVSIPPSVTEIGNYYTYTFAGSSLTAVTFNGNNLKTIGTGTFSTCHSLTAITLPEGLETMMPHCFYICDALQSIVIPSTVTIIGTSSFYNCSQLTNINFNGTIEQWQNIRKGADLWTGVPATVVHCSDGDVNL